MSELYYQKLPGVRSKDEAREIMFKTFYGLKPYFDFITKNLKRISGKTIRINLKRVDIEKIILEEKNNIKNENEKILDYEREKSFDRLFRKFIEKVRKKDCYVFKIIEEDKDTFDRDREKLFNSNKIYFSPKITQHHYSRIIGVYPPYNLIALGFLPEKKLESNEISVYIRENTYVLDKIREALRTLENSPQPYNRALLKLLENKDFVNFNDLPDTKLIKNDEWIFLKDISRKGTDIQREFVNMALTTPDFAILEGPPGSGKTTTICEIIFQAIKRNMRVLLVASTHVAVDNVLEKLFDNTFEDFNKIKETILPIRIGKQDNWKISELASQFQYENFWEFEKEKIYNFISNLKNPTKAQKRLLKILRKNVDSDFLAKSFLRSANLVCGTTIGILAHPEIGALINVRRSGILQPYDLIILDEASKTTFQEFLVSAITGNKLIIVGDIFQLPPYVEEEGVSSSIEHFMEPNSNLVNLLMNVRNVTPRKLQPRCLVIEDNQNKINSLNFSLLQDVYDIPICFLEDDSPPTISDLWGASFIIGSKNTIEKYQDLLPANLCLICDNEKGALKLLTDIKGLNLHYYSYKNRLLQEKIKPREFRLYRQDEDWESSISWRLNRDFELRFSENDFYQEQIQERIPKWLSKEDRKKLLYDIDEIKKLAFPSIIELLQKGFRSKYSRRRDKTILNDGFNEEVLKTRHRKLRYQHRMHSDISFFPRKKFYSEEALIDVPNISNEREFNYPRYQNHVCWLDVRMPRRMAYKNKKNNNKYEAKAIIRELKKLRNWTKINPHPHNNCWHIAILPFYKSQENLLREDLQRYFRSNKFRTFQKRRDNMQVELCVIDRFQGHEADIVFLSLVQNRRIGFLDCPNRLNVALTRAKYQLIIVGNRKYFAYRKHRSDLLKELVLSISDNNVIKYWKGE
ncbi:MAG: AAA family ATPase [Candidatus Heimdallarchaeota archaeon]|nr:AAA family ATPase [Candidatus Heimdallarchaeota archaeon]